MTGALLSRAINLLVIHHSASPRSATREDIEGWHRARGMDGIGYHSIIDAAGVVLAGRDMARAGAHAAGHNAHSVGLCVVGDNTSRGRGWSDAQIGALVLYVLWFRRFYPAALVLGHRDLPGASTLCPGLDVRELLRQRGADPGPLYDWHHTAPAETTST